MTSYPFASSSQMRLHGLPALERLTGLELLPPINRTNLDAHHLLVAVLWLEVAHALSLLNPWVPHHAVVETFTDHIEARLAVLSNGRRVLLDRLIDTIDLACNSDGRCRLLMLAGVKHLVDVRCAGQAIDCDFGDVLPPR
jgi:hypothetical protein